eukprot:TRINITY_DN37550_c0_g1_i1.p1 TRINITY_DN37550_c0_g1~~TRINITY_DN37550_c0_g1_i1.p1  ORF type:complete len:103 (+),score=4.72 TRINITY_DN37550_c0_g1_i1:15-323(+)
MHPLDPKRILFFAKAHRFFSIIALLYRQRFFRPRPPSSFGEQTLCQATKALFELMLLDHKKDLQIASITFNVFFGKTKILAPEYVETLKNRSNQFQPSLIRQ